MLNEILKIEGVSSLTKEQQKTLNGGKLRVRNLCYTGDFISYNGGITSQECEWDVKDGWFGSWVHVTGSYPTGVIGQC